MDKKLEARISRLEKVMIRKNEQLKFSSIVNDQRNDSAEAELLLAEAVYRTANQINDLCKQLAAIIKSSRESQFVIDIDNALSPCEDAFPKMWVDRFNRINNGDL